MRHSGIDVRLTVGYNSLGLHGESSGMEIYSGDNVGHMIFMSWEYANKEKIQEVKVWEGIKGERRRREKNGGK